MTGLLDGCTRLPHSPAVPVAVMLMVVMVAMMPSMPPMMVMVTVVPIMHFGRRELRVLLNRCRGAGIAERNRIGRRGEHEQRTNGSESQNFRELHEISPSVLCHACAEWLVATLYAIWRLRLECALNERATKMNKAAAFASIGARAMKREPL
jgi:hypothetical protein